MSKVYAVQMIEFNPHAGYLKKGYTLSGVMSFRAGNSVQDTVFVPSPIVPLKDPDKKIKVGDREIGLFDFLTGRDPEQPDTYYVHQPRKPNLPVFRPCVADSMPELRAAVDEQAQRSAQAGKPITPAPIMGQRAASERAKVPASKTVEQILAEGRNATEDPEPEPEKPAAPTKKVDFKDLVKRVNEGSTTGRGARAELDTIKDMLEADDLTYIAEHGSKQLKNWAIREIDTRAAGK